MVEGIRIDGLDDYAVDYGTRFRVKQHAENTLLRLHSYDNDLSIVIRVERKSFFSTYYQVTVLIRHPGGDVSGTGMNKDLTMSVDHALQMASKRYKHQHAHLGKGEMSLFL